MTFQADSKQAICSVIVFEQEAGHKQGKYGDYEAKISLVLRGNPSTGYNFESLSVLNIFSKEESLSTTKETFL